MSEGAVNAKTLRRKRLMKMDWRAGESSGRCCIDIQDLWVIVRKLKYPNPACVKAQSSSKSSMARKYLEPFIHSFLKFYLGSCMR